MPRNTFKIPWNKGKRHFLLNKKPCMITRWESRGDCWTSIGSPDIVQEPRFEGYLEILGRGLSSLSGREKNDLWVLRHGSPMLLRQEGASDTGLVLWRRPDLSGDRGAASPMSEVRESEARESELAWEQSLLHETLWDLCGAEVSSDDGAGCRERVEVGLAYGKGLG